MALYCRISKDPMRLEVGVEHQRADCMELACRLWPEAQLRSFVDNDVSAADPMVRRPQWQAMLDGLRTATSTTRVGAGLDLAFGDKCSD